MSPAMLPRLTPRDFAILETMLADHLGDDELLIAAIRKKMQFARIVFADDLPGEIVTIGSRVAFTVDDGWPQERRLVTLEHYVPGQDHQSVASLRGIGLLGQAAGDKARRKPADLHLVASRDDNQQPVPHRSALLTGDDPGPSAA